MKQQLASHLSDRTLKDYIIDKAKWTQYTFDSAAWWDLQITLKTLSKNRQVNISKACFNLRHTGYKNMRYYGGTKSCCMYKSQEDWIHILKLSSNFCTAMEKGLHGYTHNLKGGVISTPPSPIYDNMEPPQVGIPGTR
jgi:hypothetical protein